MAAASSPPQYVPDTGLFDGITDLLHRGLKESAINTVIIRLGGNLPLSDPRRGEIERQKRIFLHRVRKTGAFTDATFDVLVLAAGKIKDILR